MKEKYPQDITDKLMDEFKRIRKEKGVSHENLAKMCNLSRTAISFIENKKRMPTISTCLKISRALGISLAELLGELEKNS